VVPEASGSGVDGSSDVAVQHAAAVSITDAEPQVEPEAVTAGVQE
jgi:hypothetical protein